MQPATSTVAVRPHTRRRLFTRIALGALAVLLVAYLGVSALAANLLTVPRRQFNAAAAQQIAAPFQDVRFNATDGVELAGWYVPRPGATQAIVLVHGWNGSRSVEFQGRFAEFAGRLHQRNFAVLMIDMRGHGQSQDSHFSFGITERRDVIGAVEWLKGQGFAPGRIGVLGVSMGAATAVGATLQDADIGALVSDCSYSAVYPLMEEKWTDATPLPQIFFPSTLLMVRLFFGYNLADARPVDEIGQITRPVLIIHGSADAFTSVTHGRELAAAAPQATYWEVAGANHGASYIANPNEYVTRVADFFAAGLR